jgi:flagella basal body P-ring formation protein FlgA
MASSSNDIKMIRVAIAALAALLMTLSTAAADTTAATSDSSRAIASAPSAGDHSDPADAADLATQVQSQLAAMVPAGLRVDQVALGCKPPAGATLKAVAPGFAQLTSRAFMVELQKGDRSTFCSATMDASRQVLTATRDIQPNEPVTNADFQPQWVDAFGASTGALLEFPNQGPYVSATIIRAGQPLYQVALSRPIAVHPGEMVMVLVKNGPVRVHAQLQAQSQAAIGDSVTVVNPVSGIPVMVTVTGPKNAELVMQ